MTKTLTEQWREGTLPEGYYYVLYAYQSDHYPSCDTEDYDDIDYWNGCDWHYDNDQVVEVLGPVPSYQQLYGPNDGRIPVGLFTVLKLIKRDIERAQEYRHLTDLECGIKSQVVSLLKRRGWDLGKDGLVSNSDESSRKALQLEKRLEVSEKEHYRTLEQLRIATKTLKKIIRDYEINGIGYLCVTRAKEALKEMEGVK